MAQVIGQRTTYQTIQTEDRLVRHIDEKIGLLEPDEAPLITMLMRLNKRKGIDSPVHEWMEDDYTARWGKMSTTTLGNQASDTTIAVLDGTIFRPGDMIAVPSSGASTVQEYMRVTSVSSNNVYVTRNIGSYNIDTVPASSWLRLIGSAFGEGSGLPSMRTTSPVTKTTYLQIFKRVIDFSNTQIASRTHGSQNGGERKRQQQKNLKEFKEQMNQALLWGRAYQNLTGGDDSKPIRFTQGINSTIQTNVVDAGGVLTRRTFETFARNVFRYGKKDKMLLATGLVISAINEWGNTHLNVTPGEKKFGVNIQTVETGHGIFRLVRDWMLEDPASGATGFGSVAFALDVDQIEYLYLQGNGESRDTRLEQNVVADGYDRKVDQIIAESGFCIKQEKYHGKLYNITSYAA